MLDQLAQVADFFSLETLVRTWAAPWKDDVQTARNVALQDQLKIWQSNLTSRFVGFVIRSVVIFVTVLVLGVVALAEIALLCIWMLMPLLVIGLPILEMIRR